MALVFVVALTGAPILSSCAPAARWTEFQNWSRQGPPLAGHCPSISTTTGGWPSGPMFGSDGPPIAHG